MVDSTDDGIMKVHAQCNELEGKYNTKSYYRKKILKDLTEYIGESQEMNNVTDFIVMRDLNQDTESREIQNFLVENGLIDTYQYVNNIAKGQYDKIYSRGSKYIDIVTITHRLMSYVRGCKLIETDEIIPSDHRGYLIDVNIKNVYLLICLVHNFD